MAFDFPASPTVGQQFTPAGGPTYTWNGVTWMLSSLGVSDAPSDGNEYVRVNGVWRLKAQTFPITSAGLVIPVPPTAKQARVNGRLFYTSGTGAVNMNYSLDGSTFFTGASDYVIGGSTLFTGSATSPGKTVPVTTNALTLTPTTDSLLNPLFFEMDLIVQKLNGHGFAMRSRAWGYNSAATNGFQDVFYAGYNYSVGTLQTATQMGAFRLNTGNAAADSNIWVEWMY